MLKAFFKTLNSLPSLSYDIARGFVQAQDEVQKHIHKLAHSQSLITEIEQMLEDNKKMAFSFVKIIEESCSELISSLQYSSAQRLVLNHERSLIWKMQGEGILENTQAQKLIEDIEEKMKKKS